MSQLLARVRARQHRLGWAVGLLALVVTGAWLANAPAGLLGKADAVGYAVCHRIDGRSFHLGERALPLCARCTGMYLGAALGLLAILASGRSRAGSLPPPAVLALLVGCVALMGADGVNSYATLLPGAPHLYEPQNWLRLLTGLGAGLALAGLVFPAFAATMWRRSEDQPSIARPIELAKLAGLALVIWALVLTEEPVLLYPLALLSVMGLLALLTMIDSVIFMVIAGRNNRAESWRGTLLPLAGGLTLAVGQVLAIDLLRFALTGTWDGFVLAG